MSIVGITEAAYLRLLIGSRPWRSRVYQWIASRVVGCRRYSRRVLDGRSDGTRVQPRQPPRIFALEEVTVQKRRADGAVCTPTYDGARERS